MNRLTLTLAALLFLSSCAFLKESIERPYGFIPAEDAECRWGIIAAGQGAPFRVKAGKFEQAQPLVHRVTCRNEKGDYVNPGSCFFIDCDVPQEPPYSLPDSRRWP